MRLLALLFVALLLGAAAWSATGGGAAPAAQAPLAQVAADLARGDGIAAEADVARARAAGVADADARPFLAEAWLLQGRAQEALDIADASRIAPGRAQYGARIRGRARAALGDEGGAASEFAQAIALAPDDPLVWADAGRFRRSTGQAAGAIAAADRAVAFGPRLVPALLLKGEVTRDQYGLAAALPWFDRALAVDPHNIPTLLAKAATLGEMGRATDMLAATRAVQAIDPANPQALVLQATLAARARAFPLARALLLRTNGALDNLPATMLLEGVVHLGTDNVEQAIARLSDLVTLQPENRRARRLLGLAQWRDGDAESAADTLRPIADAADADSYALTLMGRALEAEGNRTGAAFYLDRAAGLRGPDAPHVDAGEIAALRSDAAGGDAGARVALVRGLIVGGQAGAAVEVAQAIERANPEVAAAHGVAGDALAAAGRWGDAAEAYRRACDLVFSEPNALNLVAALRHAGRAAAAGQALATYLQQNPRSAPARLLAAQLYGAAGDWKRAAATLNALRRQLGGRDATLLGGLGWARFQAGDRTAGMALAARAHALAPADPTVSGGYAALLAAAGRKPQALTLLTAAAQQSGAPEAWRRVEAAGVSPEVGSVFTPSARPAPRRSPLPHR